MMVSAKGVTDAQFSLWSEAKIALPFGVCLQEDMNGNQWFLVCNLPVFYNDRAYSIT